MADKLHKQTLKAAVSKYKPLVEQGKAESEIKEEINKDDKGFAESEVNEIFAALHSAPLAPFTVKTPFRDINNYDTLYEVGADVTHFEEQRLQTLATQGLVVKND